ncbi:reverse transcriptase domain-containing protein [Tanacetum coccineum]|uniref:Reverse transcriptase domain-containing protein n=1 Tax=Tanacetum coccineum TaxID=301880 RepID=A0ABQ5A6B4_9ASTR
MPPMMMTRNVGRQTTATQGGMTGGQTSRGGGRTGEQTGRVGRRTGERGGLGDLLHTIVAQVGDHISNQWINGSRNDNAADGSIHEEDRNINVNNGWSGCSYKEFVACKPKEFDVKGGVVAYIRWVEKMEAVQDISGCGDHQKVKYTAGSLIEKAPTWWNSEVQTRATKPRIIQNAILKAGVLTDEAVRNRSLKRSGERRGDDGESSTEGNVKGDNKKARTGKVFAIITNPVRKEYTGLTPKSTNYNFHHVPEMTCRMCMNCNRLGHFAKDCRARLKMVTPLNARNPTTARGVCYKCDGTDQYKSACPRLNREPGQRGYHPNQAMAIEGGQGHGNNGNPARGRAFVMGGEEAR